MSRPTPCIRPLVLALVLAPATLGAHADDTPPAPVPDAAAADQPKDTHDVLIRADEGLSAVDFRGLHQALMAQVERVIDMPARTETDHGLYDVWYAVVRPRMARLKPAMAFLGDEARWAIDPSTRRTLGMAPDEWSGFVRDAAAAQALLVGMIDGYREADVRLTLPLGHGIDKPAERVPDDVYLDELGFRGYASELSRRLRARRVAWADEVRAYRALASRLNAELLRRGSNDPRDHGPTAEEIVDQAAARYDAALAERVEDISLLLLGLRTYVAVVQSVEEDRLHELVDAADLDEDARVELHAKLAALRKARLDAQRLTLADAGRYGSLLRNDWLAPRRDLRSALGGAAEDVDEPVQDTPTTPSAAN
ncbi:MAG: hypothetical protein AB7T63_06775 [Planctomycetota bacterium]